MTKVKSLFASKTFYISLLQIAAGGFIVFGNAYPALHTTGIYATLAGIVQLLLRLQTDSAVSVAGTEGVEFEK